MAKGNEVDGLNGWKFSVQDAGKIIINVPTGGGVVVSESDESISSIVLHRLAAELINNHNRTRRSTCSSEVELLEHMLENAKKGLPVGTNISNRYGSQVESVELANIKLSEWKDLSILSFSELENTQG